MTVLTLCSQQSAILFSLLERFCAGLADAGHENEVVDLYAIGFDPVLRDHDRPNWIDDSVPDDVRRPSPGRRGAVGHAVALDLRSEQVCAVTRARPTRRPRSGRPTRP